MIFLYSDVLYKAGGIETYLHALAIHLQNERIPFQLAVAELERCSLVDELVSRNVQAYRQRRVPGDSWLVRQRLLQLWLTRRLKPGDWVFCVRQPLPKLYLGLVRSVHRRKARLAASWMFAPEFLPPPNQKFSRAVKETDAVISVARCTANQFKSIYGYEGKVSVVPYHNSLFFQKSVPLPSGPPWKIGYLGRLERNQKNLVELLDAFLGLAAARPDVELHFHGGGPDESLLREKASEQIPNGRVVFHGPYDHRHDLPGIMERCHFFVYPSRFEGGPCFTLLELMQAGRFCIASRVGGIPDLYDNQPNLGILVEPGDTLGLQAALSHAVARHAAGEISGEKIRARYLEGFAIDTAHAAWLAALELGAKRSMVPSWN
jgi:glycosyltransferase involved in cell wall biosynthesis